MPEIQAPEALRFPRGVRLAAETDLRKNEDRSRLVEKIAGAHITIGFIKKPGKDSGYSAYFEANVHADRVWTTFEALSAVLLSEVAAPLIGWKDADPTFGPYTDKKAALDVLRLHAESLQHDGYIQFGLMHQADTLTEEIFVMPSKYLQIWTNQPELTASTLLLSGVSPVESLQFIDEFPHVTERLKDGPSSTEVIARIKSDFNNLPLRYRQ
jgi:hypothetical protein